MKIQEKLKYKKGITLIALVVTIIVLIILAGVSINLVLGNNGLLTKANEAKVKNAEGKEKETIGLVWNRVKMEKLGEDVTAGELNTQFSNNGINAEASGEGTIIVTFADTGRSYTVDNNGNIEVMVKVEIPEGLEIGDIVSYTPETANYEWLAKYSGLQEDVVLKNSDYEINTWKVFEKDENTGKIELIAEEPTLYVTLNGAQGYNNGVKLLNDACNKLYGNKDKEITGRNINLEDIKERLTDDTWSAASTKINNTLYGTGYGIQAPEASEVEFSSYPSIYPNENQSVINGIKNNNGLKPSEQKTFIESNQNDEVPGLINASETNTTIQPYETYIELEFSETSFKNVDNSEENINYNLICSGINNAKFWIATRSVNITGIAPFAKPYIGAKFLLYYVYRSRTTEAYDLALSSYGEEQEQSNFLFPIITITADNLIGDKTNGWSIK